MITVTRLNGKPITLNALLIETIEETPDTMITLITGKKIMVLETVPETVSRVQQYVQSIGLISSQLLRTDSGGV
ncbi:Flagellar protein (FlbD) [Chlamydia abortus]|uniref:Flagellar FlbD family protein n=1 Tax=Paenibacillus residui TaxID=629724 RepID=A0ABW3D9L6_9BACL|nr:MULTISPECIES: flagellar FlbD family protein [Paenibacillaceae]SHE12145.1 Flagellar protein (FlbD) [Chlamydia abortus]